MTMTDPVADMLTRIRNANVAMHDTVRMPSSKLKEALAAILQREGYIEGWSAADDPTLAGVVTVSTPADWRLHRSPGTLLLTGMIRTRPGRAFAARLFRVRLSPQWTNPESPRTLAGRVASPLAVVHGERDRFIPAREAAGLFSASGGERRLFLVPRMGHAFHPAAVPVIGEAVDWALAAAPVPSPA